MKVYNIAIARRCIYSGYAACNKEKETHKIMSKRIADISNLLELLENNTLKLTNVQCKTKAFADITETDNVTPTDFIESLEYLNESKLFKDAVDFCYEFTGRNGIRVECGMKNLYMDEYFYADCVIQNGTSIKDIESNLRETIFDRMDGRISA